ncbi:hypothetical protein MUO65_03705 [bacterium]|nr:hypothetical protein [bacterium]
MFKKKTFLKVVAVAVVVSMCPYLGIVEAVKAAVVSVPPGTRVLLRLEETVSPETKSVGDQVTLSVVSDVVVNGKVVIAAGAPAAGEVTVSSKKGAVGKPAEIGFQVTSVMAVDGKSVPLRATRKAEGKSKMTEAIVVTILCCVLGLLMKGGEASFEKGLTIEAETSFPVSVEPR